MSGLLVDGVELEVGGLRILNRNDAAWARLDPRDYRARRTPWIRQVIIHTTKGKHPQRVIPGAGPAGAAQHVAEFWRGDPTPSGVHLVVDRNGEVACLADIAKHCAYHATVSNDWSVGIEMYQEADGGIYEAVLDATVKLARALCDLLLIPFQVPSDAYRGRPIPWMVHGGPDCVGVFGHRDNTDRRGRGDPGDEIYRRLIAAGAEPIPFATRGDLGTWRRRQERLVMWGEQLTVDGICGTKTIAAMLRCGLRSGREIDAAVEAPER